MDAKILNSFAIGSGGLVGSNDFGTITNSDNKTEFQNIDPQTFLSWDLNGNASSWGIDPLINNGYPYLRSFPLLRVMYNGNGDNGGGTTPVEQEYPPGATLKVSGNIGHLIKRGHLFAGWNTAMDGSDTSYSAGETLTLGADDVTLYAQWKEAITLTASPNAPTNGNVTVTATVYDPGGGAVTKWAYGDQPADYFQNSGTTFNGSFQATRNGDYTVYGQDPAGNETVETLRISNIFRDEPLIQLTAQPTAPTKGDVTVTASVYAASGIDLVKYDFGQRDSSYFSGNGKVWADLSDPVTVPDNGWLSVYVKDKAGNEKVEQIEIKNIERDPPQWPPGGGLTVSDIAQTSVKLSWPAATDHAGVAGYRIFVDGNKKADEAISRFDYSVTESVYRYTMTGLAPGATYSFAVHAYDAAGNESVPLHATAATSRSSNGGSSGGGRALSGNADLQDLQVWAKEKLLKLSPAFASGTTAYTLKTDAKQVEIVVKPADAAAKVMMQDQVLTGGTMFELAEGVNKLVWIVQAEDGTKREYTLTIHREAPESSMPTEPVAEYSDIAGHWAESDIKRAAEQRIVSGYPDGTFKPDDPVTRAEFTVMLVSTLKLAGEGEDLAFTDNEQIGAWAKQAAVRAVQAGIVSGYEDGSFRPSARITRAEMAVMIARALRLSLEANAATGFADDGDIRKWSKSAVEELRKQGIVSGRGGNKFVPKDTATRAEAVVTLLRMLGVRDQP